jgi:hypothetical protein
MSVEACKRIPLRTIRADRGAVTVAEEGPALPIPIRRVYYLHGVNGESARGKHAHHTLEQVFIAIAGSFDVLVDDGKLRESIRLSRPEEGLLMPRMVWHELSNFSAGAVCLVLAAAAYDEGDYIRNYEEFATLARRPR